MTHATITIRTDPALAGKIATLSKAMDRSRNWVIEEAMRHYIDAQAWQIKGIKAAMKSLDKGEGIPHEQVMAEAEALLGKRKRRR